MPHYAYLVSAIFSFFVKQIGPTPGGSQKSTFNVECKAVELIANGLCSDGWYYYDGTNWLVDSTVEVDCIGKSLLMLY